MSEYTVLRGHQKEVNYYLLFLLLKTKIILYFFVKVSSLKWHPVQEALLLSGGFNGTLIYWVMGYSVSKKYLLLLFLSFFSQNFLVLLL